MGQWGDGAVEWVGGEALLCLGSGIDGIPQVGYTNILLPTV